MDTFKYKYNKISLILILSCVLFLSSCASEAAVFSTADGSYRLTANEKWAQNVSFADGSLFIESGSNSEKSIMVLSYNKATYYFFNNLATYDENMTLYMALSYNNARIKECKAITINNYPALLTKITYEDHDSNITAWYCSIETSLDYITLIGKTSTDNEKKDSDEIESIIKSFMENK